MTSLRTEFVLVKKAAELLGVCPNTIRAWGAEGKLSEHRHPINGYRMYKRDDIDRLLELLRTPVQIHHPK
jgi:DNA-binding transcriptional MerR regulator